MGTKTDEQTLSKRGLKVIQRLPADILPTRKTGMYLTHNLWKIRILCLAFVSLVFVTGCPGSSPTDATLAHDTPVGAHGFNDPLTGKLVIERRLFDLATGEFGDEFESANSLRATDFISAAPDGRTFYDIQKACRDRPSFRSFDCVRILDPAGVEIALLDPDLDLGENPPAVSPDGRYILVSSTEIYGVNRVLVLDADGNIVDDEDRATTISQTGWSADGRLFYAREDTLYLATVGDDFANDEPVFQFTAEQGRPRRIAVSPDMAQVAVELDRSESAQEQEASIALMNVDGTNLRDFASSSFLPTARYPVWSPDGDWLLINAGGFGGFVDGRPPPVSLGGGLFALDTRVDSFVLDDLGTGSTAQAIRLRRTCSSDPDGCEFGPERGIRDWIR